MVNAGVLVLVLGAIVVAGMALVVALSRLK
jgi:hypothetical protein